MSKTIVLTMFGLTAGNMICVLIGLTSLPSAIERSFFQAVALLVVLFLLPGSAS